MIGLGRESISITSSFDAGSRLIVKFSRQDTINDIEGLCLKNMRQTHIKKAILIIETNDSIDTIKSATISRSLKNELEYVALGELEDGTKVLLVPVVLGDNGIEFVGVDFKVGLQTELS